MRGSRFDKDNVAVPARCEADSRAFAVDAWLLSRSSVADGIDKLAAGFVGIDDKAVRIVEWAMCRPSTDEGTDRGQADTALIIRNAMVEVCGRTHESVQ